MSIDNTAELVKGGVKAEKRVAKKAAPVLSQEHAKVKENLDALHALHKTVGADNPATVQIKRLLADSIEAAGGVVARGNTIYLAKDGVLTTIDLTPGSLVRV